MGAVPGAWRAARDAGILLARCYTAPQVVMERQRHPGWHWHRRS
jgi:hypothetical protein